MKKSSRYKCVCQDCLKAQKLVVSEEKLSFYIATHSENFSGNLIEFELDLIYESVVHWDFAFVGEARYYIYRDESADFIAWYDTQANLGYKIQYQ